jgi:hypothetical protein
MKEIAILGVLGVVGYFIYMQMQESQFDDEGAVTPPPVTPSQRQELGGPRPCPPPYVGVGSLRAWKAKNRIPGFNCYIAPPCGCGPGVACHIHNKQWGCFIND